VPNPPLNVSDCVSGIGLVPAPIEVLGGHPQLDDQVAGEVLGLAFAPFFAPQTEQGRLVRAHYDPGVRASNEALPIGVPGVSRKMI